MRDSRVYIADTHSLVWYFTENQHLSKRALEAFESTVKKGLVIIPTVVLAEIMFIAEKGKVSLSFEETLKRIRKYENYDIVPLDVDILKVADGIKVGLEMHDRLIVATALSYEASLITKDKLIKETGIVPIIW